MIIDWAQIDTVLLDMDGTLLDLHYDNFYWVEYLPRLYAEKHDMGLEAAKLSLEAQLAAKFGQLEWYCTDYWSEQFGINIAKTKADEKVAKKIAFRPYAEEFLLSLRQMGKAVWLLTNAHRDVLDIKCQSLDIATHFERLISSHDFGFSKEHPNFWQRLQQQFPLDLKRSLFVDDSLPILRMAQQCGVAHLRAIRQPDSQKSIKNTEEFETLELDMFVKKKGSS